MANIIPSILSTTESDFETKVNTINNSHSNDFDWVHIDIMDNKFVHNQSVSLEVIKKFPLDKKIELHLMVSDPYFWVSQFNDYKISRFIVHSEVATDLIDKTINFIRSFTDAEIGLALNPETEVSKITSLDIQRVIDLVLVMSVHPGFGGQKLIPQFDKIEALLKLKKSENLDFLIEEDGGVTIENVPAIIESGVDNLVVGSSLFEGDFNENIEKIKRQIRS